MKKRFLISLIGLALMSCNARKDIVYMQDIKDNQSFSIENKNVTKLEYGDRLQIIISCKDKELAALLNMPTVSFQNASSTVNTAQTIHYYTVAEDGTIQLPIVGALKVEGMTEDEVQAMLTNMIKMTGLIKDFTVTVNFTDLKFYVVGEVKNPSGFVIDNKKSINVLQALALAGDMTIDGVRSKVLVIRQENGTRVTYPLDIRSTAIFNSPAYYLKQNDVVYVEANKKRSNQSTVSGNSIEDTNFWIQFCNSVVRVSQLIYVVNK